MTSSRRDSNLFDEDAESNTKTPRVTTRSKPICFRGHSFVSKDGWRANITLSPRLFPARFLSRSNLEGDDEYIRRRAVLVQEHDDGKLGMSRNRREGFVLSKNARRRHG